jgi:SAM-dependent methyltransferase
LSERRSATAPQDSDQSRLLEVLADPDVVVAVDDLAAAERLRQRWPADLVAAATQQAELRRRAAAKFPDADRLLFTRAGLEQATTAAVAEHRAGRFADVDGTVLDLCCGIGGDLLAIGRRRAVVGVDRDETTARYAAHNTRIGGASASVVVADVHDVRVGPASAVFVDPARRPAGAADGTRRGGYSPDLDWCLVLPADRICIKVAPGVDRAVVPPGWETEFVAEGRELKEAALWSPAWATGASRATVLDGSAVHSFVADPQVRPAELRPPGRYLFDPSPAVTRAGAVADLALALDAWQIDRRIAFLSADHALTSPFGRTLVVEASLPFGVKPLTAELRRLDIGSVDLRRRGLAGDVDDLRRRLRLTGSRRATVVLTRVVNKPWTFVCTDPSTT